MKIISWNVNGLRSVYQKGALKIDQIGADILCLQEIKASKEQLDPELVSPKGYYSYFNPAKKKGYAGTAVYSRQKPLSGEEKVGFKEFDNEGRFLKLDYPQFSLINLYLPHGGRQKEKLAYKLAAYDYLLNYLQKLKEKKVILTGDFNIAHEEIDLARPKENKNNIMFTSEERARINRLVGNGFIDSFRKFYPKKKDAYTWWPYFANARARNLGWRIDYVFVTQKLAIKLKNALILSQVKGSDHCPVGVEF